MMDPGLSTSPNQFPDLGLSITGKGLSVKRFIDFKRHPASSDILFVRHLHVVLLDHGIMQRGIDFLVAQQPLHLLNRHSLVDRRWARWARSTASPNRIALGTLTIYDAVAGFTVVCTGVSLQKVPDRTFDRTGTNLTYTLLATTITEQ